MPLVMPAIAWLACLGGNIYIVGLNQLEDVEIDRINKPHLPLAANEFSLAQGRWIVAISGVLSLGLAALGGRWLLGTVGASLAIGTAYSLPPVRLKRFPFWAAFCIFAVRGAIVNLGLYLHYTLSLTGLEAIAPAVWVLTGFVLVFAIAIAIFKDVPDVEGDQQYGIATFTLSIGQQSIFNLARAIVAVCYLGIIAAGAIAVPGLNSGAAIAIHGGLLGLLAWRSRGVDLEQKSEIARFYQFIWRLFFLEYLLFPLICLGR